LTGILISIGFGNIVLFRFCISKGNHNEGGDDTGHIYFAKFQEFYDNHNLNLFPSGKISVEKKNSHVARYYGGKFRYYLQNESYLTNANG
jgi:hypothetical protein